MRKVFPAIVVTLTVILAACTTTKDLERHPELVASRWAKGSERKGPRRSRRLAMAFSKGRSRPPLMRQQARCRTQ